MEIILKQTGDFRSLACHNGSLLGFLGIGQSRQIFYKHYDHEATIFIDRCAQAGRL